MTSHLLAAGFEAKRAIEEGGANGNITPPFKPKTIKNRGKHPVT